MATGRSRPRPRERRTGRQKSRTVELRALRAQHTYSPGWESLQEHAHRARRHLERIERNEETLAELLRARRDDTGLPALSVVLDDLPEDLQCVSFEADRYRVVHGDERLSDNVAFADDVGPMMDGWTTAAGHLLRATARMAGYTGEEYVESLDEGSLKRLLLDTGDGAERAAET